MLIKKLLDAVTTVSTGRAFALRGSNLTFQAYGSTQSGTGAAVIDVDVSNDETNWTNVGTLNLTLGTTATNDAITVAGRWPYARGRVTSISGTGAAVTLTAGR